MEISRATVCPHFTHVDRPPRPHEPVHVSRRRERSIIPRSPLKWPPRSPDGSCLSYTTTSIPDPEMTYQRFGTPTTDTDSELVESEVTESEREERLHHEPNYDDRSLSLQVCHLPRLCWTSQLLFAVELSSTFSSQQVGLRRMSPS